MASFILAAVSGLLLCTSYIPFYPWALFFCLVPLFAAWTKESSPKRIFILGWLCQFIFNLVGFHWIYHTAAEFGHLPMIPSAIALIGFASFASLDLPLAGLLVGLIKRRYPLPKLYEVALYACGFFIVQSLYPTIFPWNLGYPWLWAHWPAIQWADVVGFEGLSFFTLMSQVLFWQVWQMRKQTRSVIRLCLIFLFVFVPLNIFGYHRSQQWKADLASDDARDFSVLMIQANIGNLERAYAEKGVAYQDYIVNEHILLTKQALQQYPAPDVVTFPETALPVSLNPEYENLSLNQLVRDFIAEIKIPVLTGGYRDTFPKTFPFNSVYLLGSKGEWIDSYDKTHLLAFGEYIPMGSTFPILYDWAPFISHFDRGQGPKALDLHGTKFGIQICYEGLYPLFSRGLVDQGSDIFFNATNDSWFGENFEPMQHLYMTAARTLEFRRPMIRATNTGISTVITQNGEFLELSPLNQKWYALYKLRLLNNPEPTVYARFPYVVFLTALGVFIACFIWGRRKLV